MVLAFAILTMTSFTLYPIVYFAKLH